MQYRLALRLSPALDTMRKKKPPAVALSDAGGCFL